MALLHKNLKVTSWLDCGVKMGVMTWMISFERRSVHSFKCTIQRQVMLYGALCVVHRTDSSRYPTPRAL